MACVVRVWSAARVKVGEGGVAMGEWGVRVRWNGVQVPVVGRGDMELGGPGRKEGGWVEDRSQGRSGPVPWEPQSWSRSRMERVSCRGSRGSRMAKKPLEGWPSWSGVEAVVVVEKVGRVGGRGGGGRGRWWGGHGGGGGAGRGRG